MGKTEKAGSLLKNIQHIDFSTLLSNTKKCKGNIGRKSVFTDETAAVNEYKELCEKLNESITQYLISTEAIVDRKHILKTKSKSLPYFLHVMDSCEDGNNIRRLRDILSTNSVLVKAINALIIKHFPPTSVLSDATVKDKFQKMRDNLSSTNEIIITALKKSHLDWENWRKRQASGCQSTQHYLDHSEILRTVESEFKSLCPATTKTYDQL